MHITVCICTLQRQALLRRLLAELARQETNGRFTFSAVVTDNDAAESARQTVAEFVAGSSLEVRYCVEPRRSISFARNKALELARGDLVAFIDDDEFPPPQWLACLLDTLLRDDVSGVFGPVRPHFDAPPPAWLIKGRFCERPEHPTGFPMPWTECRTGNVLLRRSAISGLSEVFRAEFGAGASDIDLFRRLMEAGHRFVWCNEAMVFEVVPPNRWKRSFLIKRALLRGRITLQHPEGYWSGLLKSAIAVPVYALALPFFQLAGHHHFMKYLVKLCDHAGKLLALVGLNPVRQREM
jgi:succinoglycan biosynthesis protein ExoM